MVKHLLRESNRLCALETFYSLIHATTYTKMPEKMLR